MPGHKPTHNLSHFFLSALFFVAVTGCDESPTDGGGGDGGEQGEELPTLRCPESQMIAGRCVVGRAEPLANLIDDTLQQAERDTRARLTLRGAFAINNKLILRHESNENLYSTDGTPTGTVFLGIGAYSGIKSEQAALFRSLTANQLSYTDGTNFYENILPVEYNPDVSLIEKDSAALFNDTFVLSYALDIETPKIVITDGTPGGTRSDPYEEIDYIYDVVPVSAGGWAMRARTTPDRSSLWLLTDAVGPPELLFEGEFTDTLFENNNHVFFKNFDRLLSINISTKELNIIDTPLVGSPIITSYYKYGDYLIIDSSSRIIMTDGTEENTKVIYDDNANLKGLVGDRVIFEDRMTLYSVNEAGAVETLTELPDRDITSYYFAGRYVFKSSYEDSREERQSVLWITDGTAAGTHKLCESHCDIWLERDGELWLQAYELERSKKVRMRLLALGAAETSPRVLMEPMDWVGDDETSFVTLGADVDDKGGVLVGLDVPGIGLELFWTDGTPEKTYSVGDLAPGSLDGLAEPMAVWFNGAWLFVGRDGENKAELWRWTPP